MGDLFQIWRNNKYGYFPSFALRWNVAKEDLWQIHVFNNLKVRAAEERTGNQGKFHSRFTRLVLRGIVVHRRRKSQTT